MHSDRSWATHSPLLLLASLAFIFYVPDLHAGPALSDTSPSATPKPTETPTPAEKSSAKRKYNLFHPTPDDELRPFNTDRPSKTDSPFTVDAGRYQLEADFANYTYDHLSTAGSDTRVQTLLVAPTYLKVGLFENADFQMLVPTYEWIRTSIRLRTTDTGLVNTTTAVQNARREVTVADGYGDMLFRLKLNVVGNEGGNFILAIIPFVKAPTASPGVGNGRLEGGINFPINYNLPLGFTLFAQTRYDALFNGDNTGYHALFSNDIGLLRTIPGVLQGKLNAYVEFASAVSSRQTDLEPLVLTADTGLILQLTPNVAVDVDGFFGLTHGALAFDVFGGIGIRF